MPPVAQSMKRTFPAGIRRKIKYATHHIEQCLMHLPGGGITWFPICGVEVPPHITHPVEGIGPWFIQVGQVRRASEGQEVLKQREDRGDAVLPLRPGNSWIEEHKHMIRAGWTHQEPESLLYLSIREGCQNAGGIFKQHSQVGNGRLRVRRGIPPIAVTF